MLFSGNSSNAKLLVPLALVDSKKHYRITMFGNYEHDSWHDPNCKPIGPMKDLVGNPAHEELVHFR
jgi:hypothetical protein